MNRARAPGEWDGWLGAVRVRVVLGDLTRARVILEIGGGGEDEDRALRTPELQPETAEPPPP